MPLVGAAGIAIVLSSYRQAQLSRGKGELDSAIARIRESGEPLTAEELEAKYTIPEGEEDLTELYVAALAGCKLDLEAAGNLPFVGSGDDVPLPPEIWPQLVQAETYLQQYETSLDQLNAAGRLRGSVRYPNDQENAWRRLRDAQQLLALQRNCRLHRRDFEGAADTIIGMYRLLETLRHHPSTVAQLVRGACQGIAEAQLISTLQDASFPADQIKRIQECIATCDWSRAPYLAALSDRSFAYQNMQKPLESLYATGKHAPDFHVSRHLVLLRDNPADCALVLGIYSDCVDNAQEPMPAAISGYQSIESRIVALHRERATPVKPGQQPPVTSQNAILPLLGNPSLLSLVRPMTTQRASIAVLALERYRRARGEIPESLSDLVPDYLDAVPTDPVNDFPLRFITHARGYTVYGVGMDQRDNVGDVEYGQGHMPTDVGLFVPAASP